MKIIRLPYSDNITTIFNTIASYPWTIWLDSGQAKAFNQRYDIISGFPYKTYLSDLEKTSIEYVKYRTRKNSLISTVIKKETINHKDNNTNPFDLINNDLKRINTNLKNNIFDESIPFWHGALGYFAYDLNQLLYSQLQTNVDSSSIPLCAMGIYAWALIIDHEQEKISLAYDPKFISNKIIKTILYLLSSNSTENVVTENPKLLLALTDFFKNNQFASPVSPETYNQNFKAIKDHIKNGNCYQINYALPFELSLNNITSINSWHVYQYFKQFNKNLFGCYFNIQDKLQVLSFSPERFIQLRDQQISAEPIKGTRKNLATDPLINKKIKDELKKSQKDRAENIMIVDLMRNDLNKVCIPGTVQAKQVCILRSFPTVHHLISTITGTLSNQYSAVDLLKSSFPGGSITGTPKLRAMQVIQELENKDGHLTRYVYCGSIGYININQNMDMSIAIRTIVNDDNTCKYWAGSGIVADSENNAEYNEIFTKLLKQ